MLISYNHYLTDNQSKWKTIMNACNLQIIGYKNLTKNIIGSSTELEVTEESLNEFDLPYNQKVFNLWRQFMMKYYRKLLPYCVDENIIAMEEPVNRNYIRKWAAIEIASNVEFSTSLDCLDNLTIKGEYFGFIHIGTALQFNLVYQQAIDYLTNNNIKIDENRPRLEIMHRDYLPDNPLSKEEFWIPINV